MVKRKPRAEIRVADGRGGMVQLHDRRFQSNWPVQLQVPDKTADTWMRYLSAACEQRGWSLSGISQHERREDSGTVTINQQATALDRGTYADSRRSFRCGNGNLRWRRRGDALRGIGDRSLSARGSGDDEPHHPKHRAAQIVSLHSKTLNSESAEFAVLFPDLAKLPVVR
jgi:hypothetical protein